MFLIRPSNILFASVYMCTLLPGNFTGWGSEGVNINFKKSKETCEQTSMPLMARGSTAVISHLLRPMRVPPLGAAGLSVALLLHRRLVLRAVGRRDLNPLAVHALHDALSFPTATVGRALRGTRTETLTVRMEG